MPFRIAVRWVQQSSKLGSWTENFWCDVADKTSALTQATNLISVLNSAKAAQVYAPSYRISEVGAFRKSEQILRVATPSNNVAIYGDADYPTTKLLLKFFGSDAATQQWYGGVDDEWISKSGNYVPVGQSTAKLNAIFAELSKGGVNWSIRILDPNRPTFIVKAIDKVTGVVTTNTNTLAVDSKVRIKGVKGLTAANGVWRITVISGTQFSLNGWTPQTDDMTKGDPTVRPQTYVFRKIVSAKVVRSTKHNVGKMPDQLSGKAKKKAS